MSLQTILLSIVGELTRGGSVDVAIGIAGAVAVAVAVAVTVVVAVADNVAVVLDFIGFGATIRTSKEI